MPNIQQRTQQLSHLAASLTAALQQLPDSDLLQSTLVDLQQLQQDFATKVALAQDQGRNLNIAIMGQVKAGKSSFLNSLLFAGKPILPEAATPKTANLTRISYAASPSLAVEYYTQQEWDSIQQQAQAGGEGSATKTAVELIKLLQSSGIDVAATLARGKEVIAVDSLDELMGKLNDYTGNNGAYTALVKMTHLHLPLPELKGFDIVDTPGMNDPVVSRTLRTQEEMSRSDVVFFLSRCSQFLDHSDMDLLSNQLPSKGVKRLILVGAQFDSALLDVGYDQDSLAKTEASLQQKLTARATAEMDKLIDRVKANAPERVALLEGLKQPILASTYAYHYANFPAQDWQKHKGMQHVYNELTAVASQEWDCQWQVQDWQRVANFAPLIAAYRQARQDKELIMQQQLDALLPESMQNMTSLAKSFVERVDQRIATLKENELTDLEALKAGYQQQIHNISQKLEQHLGAVIQAAHSMRADVSSSLQREQAQFNRLNERTGTDTHTTSYQVSTSKWYNPFTWFSSETRYSTHTSSYQYLSAADAAAQVRDYAYECVGSIQNAFEDIINERQLKLELKKALFDYLQTNSSDFDPQFLRLTFDAEIGRLKLPKLDLSYEDVIDKIGQDFQSEVRGNDMDRLRSVLEQAIADVYKRLDTEYQKKTKLIIDNLESVQQQLDSKLTSSLNASLAQVQQEFIDKEANIKLYQEFKKPFVALI